MIGDKIKKISNEFGLKLPKSLVDLYNRIILQINLYLACKIKQKTQKSVKLKSTLVNSIKSCKFTILH
jgi:hypothetical protein